MILLLDKKISRIGTSSFDIESSIFNRTNTSESIASAKVTVVCFDFDQQQSVPVFEQIINDFKG